MKSIYLRGIVQIAILLALAIAATYLLGPKTYDALFCKYLGSCGGGWIDFSSVIWMVALYTFLSTFLITALGGRFKYWGVVICNAPVLIIILKLVVPPLEFIGSFQLIEALFIVGAWGVYVACGVIVGIAIRWVLNKIAPAFMTKLS